MATALRLPLVRTHRWTLASSAAVFTAAVTLPLAYVLNLWQDEAYTLHTTGAGAGYAFAQSISFEQNAPLYFLALVLWRHLGESVFFLRLFSAACAVLAAALVPALASRYVPRIDPRLVTASVVCNPFFVWAAVEMRVYALVILLSALLLLTFFDAFVVEGAPRRRAVFYSACAALALYTQYYLAFLIAAQAIALLAARRTAFLRFALACAAAALVFAPLLIAVPGQVRNFRGAFAAPSSVFESFGVLLSIAARYVLPLGVAHATVIYGAVAILLAAIAIAARRALRRRGDGLILLMTAAALVLFAIAVFDTKVHVLNRHAASLFLPCVLSAYAAITFVRARRRTQAARVWFAATLLFSAAGLLQAYAPLAKAGDWIRATAYLRAAERPGEPIVIFQAENALPFEYYYRGPNAAIAIPHRVNFRRYDVSRFVITNPRVLDEILPHAKRLWLITAGECASANIQFGCGVLERYVATHFAVESDKHFYGSRIRRLRSLAVTSGNRAFLKTASQNIVIEEGIRD